VVRSPWAVTKIQTQFRPKETHEEHYSSNSSGIRYLIDHISENDRFAATRLPPLHSGDRSAGFAATRLPAMHRGCRPGFAPTGLPTLHRGSSSGFAATGLLAMYYAGCPSGFTPAGLLTLHSGVGI
jgi:hypothetical protein